MRTPPRWLRMLAIVSVSAVAIATSFVPMRYELDRPLFEREGLLVRVDQAYPMGERRIARQIAVHFTLKNARGKAVLVTTRTASLAFDGQEVKCAEPVDVKLDAGEARDFCVRFVLPRESLLREPHVVLGTAELEDGRRVPIAVDLRLR